MEKAVKNVKNEDISMDKQFSVCKLCILTKGLKGSDLTDGKCDYAFKTETELMNHMRRVHNITIKDVFYCEKHGHIMDWHEAICPKCEEEYMPKEEQYITLKKYNQLRSKLLHFRDIHKKNCRLIDKLKKESKGLLLVNHHSHDIVTVKKTKNGSKIIYLDFSAVKKGHCNICLRRRKTTAHHIVPLRANSKNKLLRELRIRICNECDKYVHPENQAIDGKAIIDKQNKYIRKLENSIKQAYNVNDNEFVKIIDARYVNLQEGCRRLPMMDNKKLIFPTQKIYEGRLKELMKISQLYKRFQKAKFGLKSYERVSDLIKK
jgi:hypothetical protein